MNTLEFLRSFKLFGFALFDFSLSIIGVYFLSPLLSQIFFKLGIQISRKSWLFLTVPISIVAHIVVGADTPLVQNFLDIQSGYVVKVIVFVLTYLGAREIKILKK